MKWIASETCLPLLTTGSNPQRDLMGFALPQRLEYLSMGSLKLPNEGIDDGHGIQPSWYPFCAMKFKELLWAA